MHIVRKLGVFLTITAFSLFLFLFAAALSISNSFGEAKDVKGYLAKSNVYATAVDLVTEEAGKIQTKGEDGGQTVDPQTVQAGVQAAFPPQFVQSNAEQFIDGIYNWLNGEVPRPDFRLDLTDAKNRFVETVGAQNKLRLASAPQCTSVTENTDPFSLQCRPKGIDVDAEIDRAVEKLKNDQSFLKDPVITADDLNTKKEGGDTGNFFDQANALPRVFQLFNKSPAVLAALALLNAALAILISEQRRNGWRLVARALMTTGVILAAANLIAFFVLARADKIIPNQSPAENKLVSQVVLPIIRSIQNNLTVINEVISLAYIALAVAIYMALKRNTQAAVETPAAHAVTDPVPTEPEPKAPKPPKNVQ